MKRTIVWHNNDLRVLDHPALTAAAAQSDGHALPVYCLDPNEIDGLGSARLKFRLECIEGLRAAYREQGADLLLVVGDPAVELPRIACDAGAREVHYHRRYTSPHRRAVENVLNALSDDGINTTGHWGDSLFDPESLPDELREPIWQTGQFNTLMKAQGNPPDPLDAPELKPVEAPFIPTPSLADFGRTLEEDERSLIAGLVGGPEAGMERLKVFFSKGDHARDYARRRGSLLVRNATSRLSPYLAHGALSPRMVFRELKSYETERIKNRSTRELTEELYQREFFHLVALARGDELYQAGGINHSDLEWADDPDLYARWTNGMTGWPFVDAAMRELAATGYMTNVARQNAACFLARDLEIDWRLGATYFERQLVDHEPCTNMGNWQRTAGVSPHALAHRFSIRRQAMRHDKDGSYTRQWLPELGDLPTATIHEMNGRDCHRETGMFGVRLGDTYPRPINRKTWKKRR